MYIVNIARAIKKDVSQRNQGFIFENNSKRIGFSKKNSYLMKGLIKTRFIVARKQINKKNT